MLFLYHRSAVFRILPAMFGRLVLLVAATLLSSEGLFAQSRRIDPRAAAIDSIVRLQVDSGFAGVVLVAVGDTILIHRAYNARDYTDSKLDTASTFWIGSVTKGFTAAAIMRLQEQRKLSINDPISKFFRNAPADKRSITIRQLLTHSSHLAGTGEAYGTTSRAAAVERILAEPMLYTGSEFRYQNDDYELLAAIIEVASRQKWEDYVRSELIIPAGLKHTGFWPANDWGHRGAQGMSSTSRDLLSWIRAFERGPILSAKSRAELRAPQIFSRREGVSDVSYGYGVRVYTVNKATTEVMHSGSSDDGHTVVARVLPSAVIIVLSNAGQHGNTTWSSYVAHLMDATLGIAAH